MKKISFLIIAIVSALCLQSTTSNAQFSIGLAPGALIFTGDNSETQIGAGLSVKYKFNSNMRVGADLGYYFKKDDIVTTSTMPIGASFEYLFSEGNFRPYAGVNVGAYNVGAKIEGFGSASEMYFGGAPVLGADYRLNDNIFLNANVKYHYIMADPDAVSAIGINLGVSYEL